MSHTAAPLNTDNDNRTDIVIFNRNMPSRCLGDQRVACSYVTSQGLSSAIQDRPECSDDVIATGRWQEDTFSLDGLHGLGEFLSTAVRLDKSWKHPRYSVLVVSVKLSTSVGTTLFYTTPISTQKDNWTHTYRHLGTERPMICSDQK